MADRWLGELAARRRSGSGEGITSICSAHPLVIAAALQWAGRAPVLIEATCNQVNQDGGYTGMSPRDFRAFVEEIAGTSGYDRSQLHFGGDHLGPNPWRMLDAATAMSRAEALVAACVEAGFEKIHLDASMGCRGEPPVLGDDIVAERAARLAVAAEEAARRFSRPPPLYVVGTEVPMPGGASAPATAIEVTRPEAMLATLAAHRDAFARKGIARAADRVIALVVQPGVEFDQSHVTRYDPRNAESLARTLEAEATLVFEAHSTDYQPPELLAALVADGFAILKVGPGLTFALREALYGLDRIAGELDPDWSGRSLQSTMERVMLADVKYWRDYYAGNPAQERLLRHYSYSDRIRYYWPAPEARAATAALLAKLGGARLADTLVSQFLPRSYAAVRAGRIAATPDALISDTIGAALGGYPRSRPVEGAVRYREEAS